MAVDVCIEVSAVVRLTLRPVLMKENLTVGESWLLDVYYRNGRYQIWGEYSCLGWAPFFDSSK
jgi:hypothetical protein